MPVGNRPISAPLGTLSPAALTALVSLSIAAAVVHLVPEPGLAAGLICGALLLGRISSRRRRRSRGAPGLATGFAFVLAASNAGAVDGVIEINQASALAGGISVLDAPGFPVTLVQRGSYRLTGELNVPADTAAIEIQNEQISLDLNGFTIFGGGGTSGEGIIAPPGANDVVVRNGSIRNMGGYGLFLLGKGNRIEGLTVSNNAGKGIQVGDDSTVRGCHVRDNGGTGISGSFAVIESNVITDNAGAGISTTVGQVSGNLVARNDSTGVAGGNGSMLVDNVVYENSGFGIVGGTSSGYGSNVLQANNSSLDPMQQAAANPRQLDGNLCSGVACP